VFVWEDEFKGGWMGVFEWIWMNFSEWILVLSLIRFEGKVSEFENEIYESLWVIW